MSKRILAIVVLPALLVVATAWFSGAGAQDFVDKSVKGLHDSLGKVRGDADKGNPKAQTQQGMIHYFGFGGAPDYQAAMEWFEKAAAQNYPEAMVQLGNLYENGLGVEKDAARARDYYQRAVDLKFPRGSYRLGLMYLNAQEEEHRHEEGRELMEKACKDGYQTACGLVLLLDGKPREASDILRRQCTMGDRDACDFNDQIKRSGVLEQTPAAGEEEEGGGGMVYVLAGLAALLILGGLIFWLGREEEEQEAGAPAAAEGEEKKE